MQSCGFQDSTGTATYDFSTDPKTSPQFIISSSVDDATRGLGFYESRQPANPGGYIAITRAVNSQSSQVLFPDFDHGLIVKALTFECDLRLGNPTGNNGEAADGFSISYARAATPPCRTYRQSRFHGHQQYAVKWWTGEWDEEPASRLASILGRAIPCRTGQTGPNSSGAALPNALRGRHCARGQRDRAALRMATGNGACNDITSLQTGPYDAAADAAGEGGAYTNLCWQNSRLTWLIQAN